MPEQGAQSAEAVIEMIETARDARSLEKAADAATEHGLVECTPSLVHRLLGDLGRDDPDTEDAICSALVSFGFMRRLGNLNFLFVEEKVRTFVPDWEKVKPYLPRRYFTGIANQLIQ